ncbi:unnamed protein product, partial [Sphacelaria rigidula]
MHVVVDNRSGRFLIVHPDILVSPTKVADTVLCNRKAVLQSRLASDASKSKPAVLGSLKHELFETSLLAAAAAVDTNPVPHTPIQPGTKTLVAGNSSPQMVQGRRSPTAAAASAWQNQAQPSGPGYYHSSNGGVGRRQILTSQYMTELADQIVVSQLEALYGAGLDEDTARRELQAVSGPILQWHRSFLSPAYAPTSTTSRGGTNGVHHRSDARGANNTGGYDRKGQQRNVGNGRSVVAGTQEAGGFACLGPDATPAARVQVVRVLATEDDVWCPVLGLK